MLLIGGAVAAACLTLLWCLLFWGGSWPLIPLVFLLWYLLVLLLSAAFCAICCATVDPKKQYEEHSPLFSFFADCINSSTIQLLRIHLHVTGMELLPREKFLMVGNHRGAMDPMIEMWVLRKWHTGFVAKQELFDIPIIGKVMRRSFCLSLNRGNLKEEAKTILRAIRLVKEQKATIGIYPEGTRNTTDEPLLPFKNGAFKIAQRADCPIAVAVIRNSEKATKNAPWKSTDVYLDFIGVLDRDFVQSHNTIEIGEHVREMMLTHLARHRG